MSGNFSPKGRFIYARYATLEKLHDRLNDMISEGELSLCEVEVERIRDHKGRLAHYAITLE